MNTLCSDRLSVGQAAVTPLQAAVTPLQAAVAGIGGRYTVTGGGYAVTGGRCRHRRPLHRCARPANAGCVCVPPTAGSAHTGLPPLATAHTLAFAPRLAFFPSQREEEMMDGWTKGGREGEGGRETAREGRGTPYQPRGGRRGARRDAAACRRGSAGSSAPACTCPHSVSMHLPPQRQHAPAPTASACTCPHSVSMHLPPQRQHGISVHAACMLQHARRCTYFSSSTEMLLYGDAPSCCSGCK
jgi:hypothetical protein